MGILMIFLLLAHVIKILSDEYGYPYLEKLWKGDGELKSVVVRSVMKSQKKFYKKKLKKFSNL